MTELLVWGEHIGNGKMIFIDAVDNGIKCNCICAGCGEKLIARQGMRNASHFAHASNDQCIFAGESALHQLSKEILTEINSILLPDNSRFDYVETRIEKNVADFRPDAILINGDEHLYVEIFVTHRIGYNKRNYLIDAGITTIEIDLSELDRRISKNDLQKIIIEDISRKHFIKEKFDLMLYNPVIKEILFTDTCIKEVVFRDATIEEAKIEDAIIEEAVIQEIVIEETNFENQPPWYSGLLKVVGIGLIIVFVGWLFQNFLPRSRF